MVRASTLVPSALLIATRLLLPSLASAADVGDYCRSLKLSAVAGYLKCIGQAEARAAATDTTAYTERCAAKFALKWTATEGRYGPGCLTSEPVDLDATFARSVFESAMTDVVGCLSGGTCTFPTTTTTTTTTTLPPPTATRVFVTSQAYIGDLETVVGAPGGVAAGDTLCQSRADAASLGGSWRAWLSDGVNHAIDHILSEGPYALLDGTAIASSKADLADGFLLNPIDLQEDGQRATAQEVWAGTESNGTVTTSGWHCSAWTGGSGMYGYVGLTSATNGTWTDYAYRGCGATRRLYCFEH